jgi:hypothetical protein
MAKKDNITEFALNLKEFKNKSYIGAVIGEVKSVTPLQVSLGQGDILLDKEDFYVSETIQNLIDKEDTDIKKLKINDTVLVLAIENNQTFFIVDRLLLID